MPLSMEIRTVHDAPNAEAANTAHREAHGWLPSTFSKCRRVVTRRRRSRSSWEKIRI
jgi:hypothetical protein